MGDPSNGGMILKWGVDTRLRAMSFVVGTSFLLSEAASDLQFY